MHYTRITFPHIQLSVRDGHKLRGYFGQLFKEHSPLLHNHFEDGSLRYAYPLVQYKVIEKVPHLIGLEEGSQLLTQLFLQIDEIQIEDQRYPVEHKQLQHQEYQLGIGSELYAYRLATPWMGLNQNNYNKYRQLPESEISPFLNRLLRNHLITFLKAMNCSLDQTLLVQSQLHETRTQFKNQQMSAFVGTFTTNVEVPPGIGIGKSVARGFGSLLPYQHSVRKQSPSNSSHATLY